METLVNRFIECLGHWTTSLELAFDEPRPEKWIDVWGLRLSDRPENTESTEIPAKDILSMIRLAYMGNDCVG